jgi:DNA-binding CsgD family transcriptional regulator
MLRDAAFAALDKLHRGVVLLDADGVVQHMNRAARAMLSRGHALSLRQSRLAFADAGDAAVFERCLEHKIASRLLRIGGPNHADRPYAVLVSPNGGPEGTAGFSVFIHEPPGRQSPVPTQVLRELYGLTPAEARLANALYVGQSLRSAAGTACISINTAKSVLKKVFVKCEVGTQAELLQVLSLGPRTL